MVTKFASTHRGHHHQLLFHHTLRGCSYRTPPQPMPTSLPRRRTRWVRWSLKREPRTMMVPKQMYIAGARPLVPHPLPGPYLLRDILAWRPSAPKIQYIQAFRVFTCPRHWQMGNPTVRAQHHGQQSQFRGGHLPRAHARWSQRTGSATRSTWRSGTPSDQQLR